MIGRAVRNIPGRGAGIRTVAADDFLHKRYDMDLVLNAGAQAVHYLRGGGHNGKRGGGEHGRSCFHWRSCFARGGDGPGGPGWGGGVIRFFRETGDEYQPCGSSMM